MQTLLNATKANVCASIVDGRFRFASTSGIRTAERSSWGRKAKRERSSCAMWSRKPSSGVGAGVIGNVVVLMEDENVDAEDERYSSVL